MIVTIDDLTGVNKSTTSRIIIKVIKAIWIIWHYDIKNPFDWSSIKIFEITSFPNTIGAIDCMHVRTQSPGMLPFLCEIVRINIPDSVHIQAVSDAALRTQNIVPRWPGSVQDTTVCENSWLKVLVETTHHDCFIMNYSGYRT